MALADYEFTALAVDTNIFIENQFDFSGKKLGLLTQYKDSVISFLVPKVFRHEMLKHFEEKCLKERRNAQKGLDSLQHFWGLTKYVEEMSHVLKDSTYAEKKLNAFFESTGAEIIGCNDIEVDRMLELFGAAKPPFKDTSKKKAEFPDAIALLALEHWASQRGTMVLVVSRDDGVCGFCNDSVHLKATQNLTDAFEYFLRDKAVLQKYIIEHLEDIQLEGKISERLKTHLEEMVIDPECESYYYCELSEAYVEFLSFSLSTDNDSFKFVESDGDNVVVEVSGTVAYHLYVSFDLYKYDREDKEYFKIGTSSFNPQESEEIDILITLTKHAENEFCNIEVVDMEFSQIMSDLFFEDLEPDWKNEPQD